jgi:hypothetical protein
MGRWGNNATSWRNPIGPVRHSRKSQDNRAGLLESQPLKDDQRHEYHVVREDQHGKGSLLLPSLPIVFLFSIFFYHLDIRS